MWAVVKANAYGHGINHVWRSMAQTDGFAMLDLAEAVLLRELGWQGPILLLEGFFQPQDLALLDRYRLTTAVHSDWQLAAIADATLSAPLNVYLKVNSGMNRLGFAPERLRGVAKSAGGCQYRRTYADEPFRYRRRPGRRNPADGHYRDGGYRYTAAALPGQLGRHAVAPFDPWQLGPPWDHSVWRFAERLLE